MKIKLNKLRPEDRGIVREVKIPKTRDFELEKAFAALLVKEKELDALDHVLKRDEQGKRVFYNKVVETGQQIEYHQDRNKLAREEIEKLQAVQEKIIEDAENLIKEENAKDEKTRRIETVRGQQQIILRANNRLKVYDEKRAERDVQDENLKISHKEADKVYADAKAAYEAAAKVHKENDKALSDVRSEILKSMAKGKKLGDDDFEQAKNDIEDIRKELKYKEIRPIGQNANEYIFLLIQPEEYQGDVISVKVEPKKEAK